jgi:hypothetical protein
MISMILSNLHDGDAASTIMSHEPCVTVCDPEDHLQMAGEAAVGADLVKESKIGLNPVL